MSNERRHFTPQEKVKILREHMDLAISDVAFTWSIIYHHEDGFFSKGPFLLLNQETANPFCPKT